MKEKGMCDNWDEGVTYKKYIPSEQKHEYKEVLNIFYWACTNTQFLV